MSGYWNKAHAKEVPAAYPLIVVFLLQAAQAASRGDQVINHRLRQQNRVTTSSKARGGLTTKFDVRTYVNPFPCKIWLNIDRNKADKGKELCLALEQLHRHKQKDRT